MQRSHTHTLSSKSFSVPSRDKTVEVISLQSRLADQSKVTPGVPLIELLSNRL